MSQRKLDSSSIRQDGSTESQRKTSTVRDHTDTFRRKDTMSEILEKKSMVGAMGTSMATFISTKRVARKLTSRLMGGGSWGNRSRTSHVDISVPKEPSYRMEPHKKFNSATVRNIIRDSLEDRLDGFIYTPEGGARVSKILTDDIKEKVKVQNFDRYKVICMVTLGEKTGQSLVVSSRCAWDDKRDNYATYTHDTPTLYCTATVYGIYKE